MQTIEDFFSDLTIPLDGTDAYADSDPFPLTTLAAKTICDISDEFDKKYFNPYGYDTIEATDTVLRKLNILLECVSINRSSNGHVKFINTCIDKINNSYSLTTACIEHLNVIHKLTLNTNNLKS
jgi:hypothetical protein